jgi:hypothetical protein
VEACHEHVRTSMQLALDALTDERRRERRWRIFGMIDRALSWLERMTLLPRETTTLAPLPQPVRPRLSLVPPRPSDPGPAPWAQAA